MPIWPMLMGDVGGGGGPTGPIIADGSMEWGTANVSVFTSGATSLDTTLPDNLLIAAYVGSRGTSGVAAVNSVTSTSGLVWAPLVDITGPFTGGSHHTRLSLWTAYSAAVLTNEVVQFNLAASVVCNCGGVLAIHGIVGSSGVYVLDGPILTDNNTAGAPSVTISTTYANDLIVFAAASPSNTNQTEPTGFSSDVTMQLAFGLFIGSLGMSHLIPLAIQSGVTLTPQAPTGEGLCVAFAMKGS